MPAALKRRVADEVRASGRSFNDVAVGHLAASLAVPFEPSGRTGRTPREGGSVLLRMPAELKERLVRRAAERRQNVNELIVGTLSERFRLKGREPMASTNGTSNGRAASNGKVRVAIVGVGNCANSLLQGVQYYKDASPDDSVPGLMHVDLGGYHIRDIEFVAAFDVVKGKVGVDLAEAMWAHPNDTIKFADVPKTGVKVSRGMTHDGIGKYLSEIVEKAPGETDDVVGILKETKADVLVNYLPVGSEEATKWYVEQVLAAGCAMVNCMPVFIAREPYWQRRFEESGVPIIGDDIKSQVGATITHRVLTTLFQDRGVHLDRTMQLNVGGNSDFLNMLERDRLESKKISKTNAVTSMLDYDIGAKNVHVGPSDYVPWLTDRKWAYIRMEGKAFGDVPLNAELKLEVWDSPNSAGIVIDAVRLAKLALNDGIAGALEAPSSYLMKSPPKQIRDDEAREATERFITQHTRKRTKAPAKG
jgi:myo-inositol-1-phosphate synthase